MLLACLRMMLLSSLLISYSCGDFKLNVILHRLIPATVTVTLALTY